MHTKVIFKLFSLEKKGFYNLKSSAASRIIGTSMLRSIDEINIKLAYGKGCQIHVLSPHAVGTDKILNSF